MLYYTRFVHTIRYYAVGSQCTPSSDQSGFYTSQQRSVAPCGAVRCGAVCPSLRCRVVLRCVLSFEHRAVPGIIRVVVYHFSSFFFFYMYSIRSCTAPCFFPHAKHPRTADQNVTPVTKAHSTAEHNRAICSAQAALGIIKSLFAPKSWASSFCPLCMFLVAFFLALRERSGRRQPPAERSPCVYYIYAYEKTGGGFSNDVAKQSGVNNLQAAVRQPRKRDT